MTTNSSYVLGDTGDLNAPKDSIAFARAAYLEARSSLNDTVSERDDLRFWIDTLLEGNRYQLLTTRNGQHFLDWEQFCKAPQPFGLGYDADAIDAICNARDRKRTSERVEQAALETTGEVQPPGGNRQSEEYKALSKLNNDTLQSNRADRKGISRTTQYKLDYLARHAPDLLEDVRGRQKSADAAYRQAKGLPKKTSVTFTPEKIAQTIIEGFTRDQIAELIERLVPYLPLEST